jgi:hypothetical protein
MMLQLALNASDAEHLPAWLPAQVLDNAVIARVRQRLLNSLRAFLAVSGTQDSQAVRCHK